jgi:phage antirepressor YoqD-like protein|nr:MAG TPA: antirepressor protein [Caudoviricetes sp.]
MLELKECKMNHVELCGKINELRKMEGNRKTIERADLLKKIIKEINVMKELKLENSLGNFSESTYTNSRGKKYPTYIMNRDAILQMCASESVYVRAKMIEYINTLEEQVSELDRLILKSLDPNLTKEERIEIERRRAELSKERDEKASWFDDFLNSNGCYSSTQVAKLFKLSSAQKLNKILNENKIIYKKGTSWLPYSDVDKSWYKLIVGSNNDHNYSQLKFSPKGVYEISKLLEIEFEEEDLKKLA